MSLYIILKKSKINLFKKVINIFRNKVNFLYKNNLYMQIMQA